MKKKLPPPTKRPTREKPKAPQPPTRSAGRTVLITVSGMSPAIITETVWALAHPHDDGRPVVPDEVVVITTAKGAADLKRDVLTANAAMGGRILWETLRDAVRPQAGPGRTGADILQLAAPRVIELPDPKRGVKRPADDLRSLEDNIAAANFILEEIRRHVENPETHVIASIAGGRKTMGALLYACMSLIGRETDRVTHVLVSEPFETCRGFFFPKQPIQDLVAGREATPVKARNAKIDLADIPFVPLRNRFTDLADLPGTFTSLVARYAGQLKTDASRKVPIVIDYPHQQLSVDGVQMRMRAKALTILHYLLNRQDENQIPRDQLAAEEGFKAWKDSNRLENQADCVADDFRHELNHLRTVIKRDLGKSPVGVTWIPPKRSLAFPPFKLTVR